MMLRNLIIFLLILISNIALAEQDCPKAAKLVASASVLATRNSEANNMITEAYSLCPSSVEVVYAYGNYLLKNGSKEEAMEVFSKIDDPILNISKAGLLAELGKFEEGSAILEKVLGENPRKVEALQVLANLEYKRDNFKESERLIRLAIQERPEDFALFFNLGITLENLKRYEEAKLSLLSSIRLNSNNPESYTALARIYLILSNLIEAKQLADKAITIAPDNSQVWFTHGLVNQQLSKHDQALISLRKAYKLEPENTKIQLALAVSEIYQGNKKYIKKLTELYDKNQDSPDFNKALLWAFLYINDYKSAEKYMDKFILMSENDAIALNNLGVLHNKLGKAEQAKSYFDKSIELNPSLKQAQVNLGLLSNN